MEKARSKSGQIRRMFKENYENNFAGIFKKLKGNFGNKWKTFFEKSVTDFSIILMSILKNFKE